MTERMLIATTPSAMESSHAEVVNWCATSIEAAETERVQAADVLERARRAKWNTKPFKAALRRVERRITFLSKLREAVEAGYYLVPNFMLDAFAIRTDAKKPRKDVKTYRWANWSQPAKALPPGEGRYVSEIPMLETWTEGVEQDGKTKSVEYWSADQFQDVTFPMEMAKPEIIAATEQAMALQVFDEIGIARDFNAGGDPMILGRILNPKGRQAPAATFFIAWALPLDRW